MPEVPASMACHVEATSPPTGEVAPRPVTTTRVEGIRWGSVPCGMVAVRGFLGHGGRAGRRPPVTSGSADRSCSALRALDEGDGVADGLEVLDLVVGDGHAELLLGGHDDLDHGERVDVEVVHEGLVQLDVVGVDAGHLVDDVGTDFFGGGHGAFPSFRCGASWLVETRGGAGRAGWCDQGTVTTWAAYASPAPKAMRRAVSPLRASPSSIIRSRASGTDAADVLPWSATSRAMRTEAGSFIERAIASMIRMLAWWGTKTSSSSMGTPAASSACWPILAIANDAQRKTGLPCIVRCGITPEPGWVSLPTTSRQSSRCRMRSNCSPSEPQTTGPMPGVSLGPTTAAPAPSAKMNAVPRSPTSVRSESRSTPITRAWPALPARTRSAASATPWQKPAQAAEMSNAAAWSVPISWAIAVATAGVCSMWLTVATTTQSICRASMPALSRALREASTAISCTVSSGVAHRRCLMPERCWIHSSLESIASMTSAFGITRDGR